MVGLMEMSWRCRAHEIYFMGVTKGGNASCGFVGGCQPRIGQYRLELGTRWRVALRSHAILPNDRKCRPMAREVSRYLDVDEGRCCVHPSFCWFRLPSLYFTLGFRSKVHRDWFSNLADVEDECWQSLQWIKNTGLDFVFACCLSLCQVNISN